MLKRLILPSVLFFVCCHLLLAAVDCNYPRSMQQGVVCRTPELMDLDHRLSVVLEDLLPKLSPEERHHLEGEQGDWDVSSGGCWDRVECLKKRYLDRIAELEARSAQTPATPVQMPWDHQAPLSDAEREAEVRRHDDIRAAATDSAERVKKLEQERENLIGQLNALANPNEPKIQSESNAPQRHTPKRFTKGNEQADLEANQAKIAKLQSDIADLKTQLESRQQRFNKGAIERGRQVLATMRSRANSQEIRSLREPLQNSSSDLNKACDRLATALDKGNSNEIVRLTNALQNNGNIIETQRKAYVDYLAWEARRSFPPRLTNEITVQGVAIGSTYSEVRKVLGATCSDLPSNLSNDIQATAGRFDVRQDGYERMIGKDHAVGLDACLTVGGRKRQTWFSFSKPTPDEQNAYDKIIRAGESCEGLFKWAYLRSFEHRRLIRIEIVLGTSTDSYLRETVSALSGKYRLTDEPTAIERERFNHFRVGEERRYTADLQLTNRIFYPVFDSSEIDYYFADYRVWLSLKHSGDDVNLSVHYADSQTAQEIKRRRQAARIKASDF